MKIRYHGKSGELHSWSIVATSLIRAMKSFGHDIYIKSTDNLDHFPEDLRHMLLPGYHAQTDREFLAFIKESGEQIVVPRNKMIPDIEDGHAPYDMEFAYTVPLQYPRRFFPHSKLRVGIWNYESSVMPPGWQEYIRALDYLLPSSQYSFDIFANNGIPKNKMLVVPHGVDTNIFNSNIPPFKFQTQKKVRILHNAIPHFRKLHDRVIKGYLDAFTGDDDVCLILKTKFKTPDAKQPFESNVKEILERIYNQYDNPAEIEIINDKFIDDIGSLYTGTDIVVSMSSCEGFNLTLLEALACNSLVISPGHGGALDFINNNNSLLINTKEMIAPLSHQYWTYAKDAVVGDPDTKHFSELLRYAYENLDYEKNRIKSAAQETVKKFSWENAAKMMLDLPMPAQSKRIPLKRKVLYIIPYGMIGGAEFWVKDAIRQLDKNLYEAHVVFLNSTPDLLNMYKDIAVVEDLTKCGQLEALKCMIEAENYAVINFYNSFSIYCVLKDVWTQGYRCRIVEIVHSDLVTTDSMSKVAKRESFVAMIIAVSKTMTQKLTRIGNKNVFYMPQPINWDKFKIERSKDVLKEFNIPDKFVIGFVGRLSMEKNIPIIMQCANRFKDISFVIVGEGPHLPALKQMAGDNVYFVGKQNNVERFYAAFDILMLPSLIEGLPLVVLEAMTCGTPVIASRVGALGEIVQEELLSSNANNIGFYIAAIEKLKNDETWKRISEDNIKRASSVEGQSKNINVNLLYNKMF